MTLLGIWGEKQGPWMQALHCIFGIGTWISPLLVKPFLAEDINAPKTSHAKNDSRITINSHASGNNDTTPPTVVYQSQTGLSSLINWNDTSATTLSSLPADNSNNTNDGLKGKMSSETNIAYAYLIVGILYFTVFIAMLAICWTTTGREVRRPIKKANKSGKNSKRKTDDLPFKVKLVTLVFVFYLTYCTLEMNYGYYLLIYAVKHLDWSKKDAASLTSGYYGSFTAARGLGILLVKFLRPQVLMTVNVTMTVIALAPALFFAHAHVAVMWIATILFGMSLATIFALGITWTERYIEVTGLVGSVFMIACSGGELVGPILISLLFKTVGYGMFMYVMFAFSVLNLLIFICMQLLAWQHGERYAKEASNDWNRNQEDRSLSLTQLNNREKAGEVDLVENESLHAVEV